MNYLSTAEFYVLERGWSVIPVNGNKEPADSLKWKEYQTRRPSPKEFREWFGGRRQPAGIAIITGAISRLAVLDIDDRAVEARFAAAFPDLMETMRVRTPGRSGLHLYFALEKNIKVGSEKFAGADLKAEGGYVVAPTTVYSSGAYVVESAVEPLLVTPDIIEQIGNWFKASSRQNGSDEESPTPGFLAPVTSPADALALYRNKINQYGSRNMALFVTASVLRSRGWTQESVEGSLAIAHTVQPHPTGQASESDDARRREAARTIKSAYDRPLRIIAPRVDHITGVAWSDNRARESMLQRDVTEGTAFWRVYDALVILGMADGELFSYNATYRQLARLGVGRRALNRFLNAAAGGGFLVPHIESPLPPPDPHLPRATAETSPNDSRLKRLEDDLVHTPKRSRNARGRKADPRYAFPSLDSICKALGIKRSAGDPITRADVQSPVKYRCALQREFIRRLPNIYSLGLLATRLGVSTRSIQRYHIAAKVQSQPTYETLEELSIPTLDDAIPQGAGEGSSPYYIQDEYGTRFTARGETARWLLNEGKRVWLMKRGYNWYWLGAMPAALQSALATPSSANTDHFEAGETVTPPDPNADRIRGERVWALMQTQKLQATGELPPQFVVAAPEHLAKEDAAWDETIRVGQESLKAFNTPAPPHRRTRRFYRKPLEAARAEWVAKKLHALTQHKLSLINARKLVDAFGVEATIKAHDRAQWMSDKLTSPAGFIITQTQYEWRKLYPQARLQMPTFKVDKRTTKAKGQSA